MWTLRRQNFLWPRCTQPTQTAKHVIQCNNCNRTFATSEALSAHTSTYHNLTCAQCGGFTNTKTNSTSISHLPTTQKLSADISPKFFSVALDQHRRDAPQHGTPKTNMPPQPVVTTTAPASAPVPKPAHPAKVSQVLQLRFLNSDPQMRRAI